MTYPDSGDRKVVEFSAPKPFDSYGVDLSACTEGELRPELVVTLEDIEAAIKELGGMPERPRSIFDWPDSGDHDWGME